MIIHGKRGLPSIELKESDSKSDTYYIQIHLNDQKDFEWVTFALLLKMTLKNLLDASFIAV